VLTVFGNQSGDGTTPEAYITLPGVKGTATVTADSQTATYGSAGSLTASVSGATDPGGQVTFSEGSTTIGSADVASDGTATLPLTQVTLGAGSHTITASFAGSAALNDSSTTFTLTVAKASTTVVAGDASGNVGATASVPVNVTSPGAAVPDGTVTILSGANQVGTGTLSGGSVTVSVDTTGLSGGDHPLTVNYDGNDNFTSSTKDITLTLSKLTSTVTAGDQTATYGSAGSLTATVNATGATGEVTFSEGPTQLGQADVGAGGVATLALTEVTLGAGPHTITASYGGDDSVAASSKGFTLTVNKATTTVTASGPSGLVGSTVSVPVTVSSSATAKPDGTVTLLNGLTPVGSGILSGGKVTIDVTDTAALGAGDTMLSVSYGGGDNFAASVGSVTLSLSQVTTTISAPDQTATYGAPATLAASVPTTGAENDTVTFSEGSTTIGSAPVSGNGSAILDLASMTLGVGQHTIAATFDGDVELAGSSTTFTLTVSKAATTVVSSDVGTSQGSTVSVPVTVTATGIMPDGTVTVLDGASNAIGTATLTSGAAAVSVNTSGLVAGANTVTVSYAGNANFIASTKTITITITVALKSSSVTATPAAAAYGGRIVLPITVSGSAGTPTGKVQILYGTRSLGTVTLVGGKASLSIYASVLGVGGHAVLLKYLGDSVYASSTGVAKATVTKAVPIMRHQVVGGPIRAGAKGPKVSVTVAALGVQPTGRVTLVIGKRTVHGPLVKGHVSLKLPVFAKAGKVKIVILYAGSSTVGAKEQIFTVTVKRRR
jgi:hypothetical protein